MAESSGALPFFLGLLKLLGVLKRCSLCGSYSQDVTLRTLSSWPIPRLCCEACYQGRQLVSGIFAVRSRVGDSRPYSSVRTPRDDYIDVEAREVDTQPAQIEAPKKVVTEADLYERFKRIELE
jgi:hypothetical protein